MWWSVFSRARALSSTAPGSAPGSAVRWAVATSMSEVRVHTCRSWTSATPSISVRARLQSVQVDLGWGGLHQDAHGLGSQPPRPGEDEHTDRDPDDRVHPRPPCELEGDRGDDHPDRSDGVGEDLQVGTFEVEALLRAGAEQCEGHEVGGEPERGDDQHRRPEDLRGLGQAADRLVEHVDGHPEQEDRVGEGGQDLQSVEPEGVVGAAGLLREVDRSQGHADPEHVGEHVAGIREQRERVGDHSHDHLDDHEHGEEHERSEETALVAGAAADGGVVVIAAHGAALPVEAGRLGDGVRRRWSASRIARQCLHRCTDVKVSADVVRGVRSGWGVTGGSPSSPRSAA